MAFFTHWYDLLCLAMVVGAVLGSLWAIRGGNKRGGDGAKYESLLVAAADDDDDEVSSTGSGLVRSQQLWMSRWRAVHPAGLLALRLVAAVAMSGVLVWDICTYDWSIMLYYTE